VRHRRKPAVQDLTGNQTANHVTVTHHQGLVPLDRLTDEELAMSNGFTGRADRRQLRRRYARGRLVIPRLRRDRTRRNPLGV